MELINIVKCEAYRCEEFCCEEYCESDENCINDLCHVCKMGTSCRNCENREDCEDAEENIKVQDRRRKLIKGEIEE